jgi:nucleoid-associated protein YgaU
MPRMRTAASLLAAALLALTLAACAGGGVTVRPGPATATARAPGCRVEILYAAPARPFDVLADLESHVTLPPRAGAPSVLVPKACELGADALLVLKSQELNELGHVLLVATAIKYRPEGAAAAEPAAAPAAPASATPPQAPQPAPKADEMPH